MLHAQRNGTGRVKAGMGKIRRNQIGREIGDGFNQRIEGWRLSMKPWHVRRLDEPDTFLLIVLDGHGKLHGLNMATNCMSVHRRQQPPTPLAALRLATLPRKRGRDSVG